MDHTKSHFYIFICGCILTLSCGQQDDLTSEAIILNKKLQKEYDTTTHQDARLKWLELAFEKEQIVSNIIDSHEYVLNYYHHTGFQFRLYEQYRESLNMYRKFFSYYDKHENEFTPEIKEEFHRKRSFDFRGAAIAYEKLGHVDSAYLEHQKNLYLVETKDDIFNAAAHNDYGMFLLGSLQDSVAALEEFRIAYDYTSENFPDHDLLGSIRENIGKIYLGKDRLAEAYELFFSNYLFYRKYLNRNPSFQYRRKAISSAVDILKILRVQNKTDLLEKFYEGVLEFYSETQDAEKEGAKEKLDLLNIRMQYLLANKNFERAYEILDTIRLLSVSHNFSTLKNRETLQSKMNDLTLASIKSNYYLDKKQKEVVLLNQRLIIWLISIISVGFIGVLTFEYYRRNQLILNARNNQHIAEQQKELTTIRNHQLKVEIESKKRDLSDFAINLTQNQEWAKVLASKLDKLKKTKGRERKKLMDEFESEVYNKTTFDTNTKEFFERLDKLSDSFYSHLNAEFPDLSKNEKRLCSLIRLKVESRNIATLQNITLASLNTSRYRLRKKMNLAKEEILDNFIQSL